MEHRNSEIIIIYNFPKTVIKVRDPWYSYLTAL